MFFPAIITLDKKNTFLAIMKICPLKIIKLSPSAKINPSEIWQNLHLRKLIHVKINLKKISLLEN